MYAISVCTMEGISNACKLVCRQVEVRQTETPAERDLWTMEKVEQGWVDEKVVASRPKSVDVKNRPKIAAVEVDPAGCSYNPGYEQHQDAVAVAVAAENMKIIDRELQPKVLLSDGEWQCNLCNELTKAVCSPCEAAHSAMLVFRLFIGERVFSVL